MAFLVRSEDGEAHGRFLSTKVSLTAEWITIWWFTMLLALWLFYSDVQYIAVWRWLQHCTVYILVLFQYCLYRIFGATLFSDVSYNVVSRYIFYNIIAAWFVHLLMSDVPFMMTTSRAKSSELSLGVSFCIQFACLDGDALMWSLHAFTAMRWRGG